MNDNLLKKANDLKYQIDELERFIKTVRADMQNIMKYDQDQPTSIYIQNDLNLHLDVAYIDKAFEQLLEDSLEELEDLKSTYKGL